MTDFRLPISDTNDVPVFDCHVILSLPDADEKMYRAVVSNLPEVTAQSSTERDCLHQIVTRFKSTLRSYQEQDSPVPWKSTKLQPQPGQQERWIPIHL